MCYVLIAFLSFCHIIVEEAISVPPPRRDELFRGFCGNVDKNCDRDLGFLIAVLMTVRVLRDVGMLQRVNWQVLPTLT